MVAAARLGAGLVVTEDMQYRRLVLGILIEDHFRTAPVTPS